MGKTAHSRQICVPAKKMGGGKEAESWEELVIWFLLYRKGASEVEIPFVQDVAQVHDALMMSYGGSPAQEARISSRSFVQVS